MTPELAATTAPVFAKGTVVLLLVLMVRDMIWKAIGLWKAGTKRQLARFICIFIFNTLGILPIIYISFFQKKEKAKK
jgi:methionyl-tRNA synthetase